MDGKTDRAKSVAGYPGVAMERIKLGDSSIETTPIIFGAWAIGGWYWGGTDDGVAVSAIRASMDEGVCAFDTAPVYGLGHSETILGKAIAGRREEVLVMTKLGLRWDCTEGSHFFDIPQEEGGGRIFRNLRPASIRHEVEQSLRRLGIDTIDLLQCHWPDPTTPVEESMQELAKMVGEGKARAIGVSNFGPELLGRAKEALGSVPLASTQPRYSLLNRRIERDVLPWVRENGTGCIVYSPIERGLLSGTVDPGREFPDSDGRSYDPMFSQANRIAVLGALEGIRDLAEMKRCSFAQLCAAWCFHQPGVTAAIVGARTPAQARENAAAGRISLTQEECGFLGTHFSSLKLGQEQ
jgi:methylglyoxal reductase